MRVMRQTRFVDAGLVLATPAQSMGHPKMVLGKRLALPPKTPTLDPPQRDSFDSGMIPDAGRQGNDNRITWAMRFRMTHNSELMVRGLARCLDA
jgi:hypothetical protein